MRLGEQADANNAARKERLNEVRSQLRSIDCPIDPLRWAHVQEFVMGVEIKKDLLRGYPGAVCAVAINVIAEAAGLTVDQAKRARLAAKRIGLIRTMRWSKAGSRTSDLTIVVRERLQELVDESRQRRAAAPTRSQLLPPAPRRSQLLPPAPTYKEPEPDPVPDQSSSSPRPTAPDRVAVGDCQRWKAVEEELLRLGMKYPRKALRAAAGAGAAPGDVEALVAHWRPRRTAWGEFAIHELHHRIRTWLPGEGVEDRWPPARPGWRDPELVAAASTRKAAVAAHEAHERAAHERAASDRESRFGAALDAMREEEVLALCGGQPVWIARLRSRGRGDQLLRWELLDRLAASEEATL